MMIKALKQRSQEIAEQVGAIHGVVHSVAFANADDLRPDFFKHVEMALLLHKIQVRFRLLQQQMQLALI